MANNNTDQQIRAILDRLVQQISGLVKQAAIEDAVAALKRGLPGVTPAVRSMKSTRPAVKASSRRVRESTSSQAKPKKGRGAKRSPVQIARTVARALEYVKAHPGARAEYVRKDLSLSPSQTADALGRLLDEKKIKSKGEKRSTTYSVA